MAISKLSKGAIALAASTLAMNPVANAHEKDYSEYYSDVHDYKAGNDCKAKVSTILAPAPAPYVEPVKMVPKTILQEVTTYEPVTKMVPTTIMVPASTITSSTYSSDYTGYSTTPTYTQPSYTNTIEDTGCMSEGQPVACPPGIGSYTSGTTYAPHTSGTYRGYTYPSGNIIDGADYNSGTITGGYTTPTYSSGTIDYYSDSVDGILAGRK